MKYEKTRNWSLAARASATRIGSRRQVQERRKCPVPECQSLPRWYSRYCNKHADKLRRYGHPTLNLKIRSKEDYANCLKVGRWLRDALTGNDMDRRAWLRIEGSLTRLARDHYLKHPIPVIARRNDTWRNDYKALCAISKRLEKISAEEMIAAYLGMASVIITENEILVTSKQLELMLNKAGGRAATRFGSWTAKEPLSERTYRWKPSGGTYTQIGKVIHEVISREFGAKWYKEADVKLATRQNMHS